MKKKYWVSAGLGLVILVLGTSMAYFTSTDTVINSFTIGSVRIQLHEEAWENLADTDHNGIPDMAEFITPMKTLPKDPVIENTGDNPAWVYLQVRIPVRSIITAYDDGTRKEAAETELFFYKKEEPWELIEAYSDDRDMVYVYSYPKALDPGQKTNALFTEVTFCNSIEGQELENTDQVIAVKAMAIQSEQTGDRLSAYDMYLRQSSVPVEKEDTQVEKEQMKDDSAGDRHEEA